MNEGANFPFALPALKLGYGAQDPPLEARTRPSAQHVVHGEHQKKEAEDVRAEESRKENDVSSPRGPGQEAYGVDDRAFRQFLGVGVPAGAGGRVRAR